MKTGKILFGLIFILCSIYGYAQQSNVEVKGVIIEEGNKEPIEQATVRLLSVRDSSLIDGIPSGKNGTFSIKNVKPGSYLLHITYVGFEPIYQPIQISGQRNPVDVGSLGMTDGTINLGDAVVVGKLAEMTVNNDTIEYNADAFKVPEGSMLEDLLKKMPGVEIDSEGKIFVNGVEKTKILMDGKQFFSDDPKVASKNLPANMIEKVQSYEKRSDMAMLTGFDDGDEENVLNLVIKQGMKQGWIGNAYAGYGNKERYEANAFVSRLINHDQFVVLGNANNNNNMGATDLASSMFSGMGGSGGRRGGGGFGMSNNGITTSQLLGTNFNKELNSRFTLNGNVRYNHGDNKTNSMSRTENIISSDSSTFEDDQTIRNSISHNVSTNFRMEWKPDSATTIIFRPEFRYSNSDNSTYGDTYSYDMHNNPIYTALEDFYSSGKGHQLSGNLDYSRKLNNKGRVFSFSLSGGYNKRDTEGTNWSETEYFQRTSGTEDDNYELIDQEFTQKTTGHNYRGHVSWVEPLGRNNFLQASYSFRQNRDEQLKYTYSKDDYTHLYNLLDSAYSQSSANKSIEQRVNLSFRAMREKYNYTVGFNIDPSYRSIRNFVGDSTLSEQSRSVVNFSPTAQFNYLWNRRTNLRITYNGNMSQPSMSQLQPVREITSSTNTTIGNPDLKPSYRNNLNARYQNFNVETQRMMMFTIDGSYTMNAIVSKSQYLTDGSGKRVTTYENVNGNFNTNLRAMVNAPLRNRKFSYNTSTTVGYSESKGFVNADKNTSRTLNMQERAGMNFRSDYLDVGVTGNLRYSNTSYTLQEQTGSTIWNYGLGGTTTIYLPYNFRIESDINYSANSGYSDGYDQSEVLWNAMASKSFLKGNKATIQFKIYDILKQRTNITRSVTANYVRDSETNTLTSYFIIRFVYKFQKFGGGTSADDMRRGGGREFRGGGPGGGPGGPPMMF